jgi:hypothetical protein
VASTSLPASGSGGQYGSLAGRRPAGGRPVSAIAEEVYGHKGGHQNRRVEEVLKKWQV